MRFSWRIVTPALLFAPGTYAQERLSLADAVAKALASHPQLDAAAARISVAQGLRQQAGIGPNPRLILQSENTRVSGSPPFSYSRDADTYAIFAQTIETAGKRGHRVEVAAANARRSELEREFLRRQIISRVSAAYWVAAGAASVRDLLEDEVTSFERVVQFHRDRVREGATAEVNLFRIEVERDRLAGLARSARQEAERATISLLRVMGRIEFPAFILTDGLDGERSIGRADISQVLKQRPETQLADEAIEQALANLRLQQANASADPDAHIGYKRTAGFNTLFAAVQIPLPLRNRNQGQIEAAAAELRAAEFSRAAAQVLIRSEVAAAQSDFESKKRLLDETLQPMLKRSNEVYRIEDAAYREGGSDILRLLDAERIRIETQLMYTRTLAEYQQSAVALEAAQGSLR